MSDRLLTGLAPAFTGAALRSRLPAMRQGLALALRVIITRRALPLLDDRALKDIGVTRAEALAEAQRAPWDLDPPRRRRVPRKPSRADVLWGALHEMVHRYRTRRGIAALDERALKDMGISLADAEAEANKPFWRA